MEHSGRWVGPAAILLTASSLVAASGACAAERAATEPVRLTPGALNAVARVDERFQSYNVEMVEVTGGRFWAPYPKPGAPKPGALAAKPGDSPSGGVQAAADMFSQRAPLDLHNNRRLRNLTKALGPAYIRVGGAWANSVYFQDDDAPARVEPPAGYQAVLTRAQWAGVVEFAQAVDAKIVTSFGVSVGARDADGVWNPSQARRLVEYTRSLGGRIHAAELINEPNVGARVGLPTGYDAATFARDQAVFRQLIRSEAPEIKTVGPVTTGEAGFAMVSRLPGTLSTEALLSAEPRATFDIYAFHFYGAGSQRCARGREGAGISPDQALSEAWLARADQALDFYKPLHDRFAPATPIWITEIAEASCGGDAWAATFLDTFRYADQMGRLAKRNVAAIFHNTLSASDYALIDDTAWRPRPSYWAALLWRRLMGDTVLDAGALRPGLHLYAQCLRGSSGGVTLLAINLDRAQAHILQLPVAAQRFTLTADDLQSETVKLNGRVLALTADDELPKLRPVRAPAGRLSLTPASITFLAFREADNPACR